MVRGVGVLCPMRGAMGGCGDGAIGRGHTAGVCGGHAIGSRSSHLPRRKGAGGPMAWAGLSVPPIARRHRAPPHARRGPCHPFPDPTATPALLDSPPNRAGHSAAALACTMAPPRLGPAYPMHHGHSPRWDRPNGSLAGVVIYHIYARGKKHSSHLWPYGPTSPGKSLTKLARHAILPSCQTQF